MRRLLLLVPAAVALAGCSVLPQSPPPLPSTAPDTANTSTTPTPSASPSVAAVTVADGFTDQEHAALRIRARTCDEFTVGSGFMLDAHTVVTNRHVVEDAQNITLTTYDGEQYEGTSSVMADFADLALVTVDEPLEFAAPIGSAEPAPDDELDVVGYPLGGPLETRTGPYVKRVPDTIGQGRDDVDLIKVEAEHGNSGSAVYDPNGQVVGVLYATDKKGESFAVTLQSLNTFLSDTSLQLPNDADCG
ncbi:S1 family peptidase [Demequina aurantiaca]|uniref:S1 family peptidase n=1 Tax=Demequina aurantiaca TaxID=676200 RepID=UPI000784E6C5|nr:serine protease [Demequina aurantiaca]